MCGDRSAARRELMQHIGPPDIRERLRSWRGVGGETGQKCEPEGSGCARGRSGDSLCNNLKLKIHAGNVRYYSIHEGLRYS
jgi:hypothetical protein